MYAIHKQTCYCEELVFNEIEPLRSMPNEAVIQYNVMATTLKLESSGKKCCPTVLGYPGIQCIICLLKRKFCACMKYSNCM